jgi:hypothetical protein
MPALHLSSSFHLLILLVVFIAACALAWFSYRITIPPVSQTKRFVFVALRGAGLFFLFFLIGEPFLSIIHHTTDRPVVAVLIDHSQSMSMNERIGNRAAALRSVVSSDVWKELKNKGAVSFFLFDAKIKTISVLGTDSISLNGAATDISEALKSTKKIYAADNLQAVVLITDGNSTVGSDPLYDAEDMGVPVFTVGVGDTSEQKDILIRKVLTNELTYAGNRLPVNVTVHSAGFDGEHVQLLLKSNGKELDRQPLTLETGSREYAVSLSCIPEQEGIQKYTVELSSLPGELTAQNNRQNVFVKVLKSKMQVAFVAAAPSEDVAFIRRALESDKNIELKTFIEHAQDQPQAHVLDQKLLTDAECVVVVGFPVAESISGNISTLFNALSADKPFLFVASRTTDFSKLKSFEQHLPFMWQQIGTNEEQVFASVTELQRTHSILKTETNDDVRGLWDKLPPVFRLQGNYHAKPEAIVLASVRIQSTTLNDPLIIVQNLQQKKSEAILAYGIWRWQLLSDAGTLQAQLLERMLVHSVRWLTTREDDRRVRVQPSKDAFTSQEPVEFTAQVYDENYQPVDDAQIEVQAAQGKESSTLALNSVGSGQYHAAFDQLPEGDYRFTARVQSGGKEFGTSRGVFSIGGTNAEFLETRMNQPLLQQMAARTGGKYYVPTTISTLPQDVAALPNFKSRELTRTTEIELWNSRWILALVILLFSLEWFLRKQSGML